MKYFKMIFLLFTFTQMKASWFPGLHSFTDRVVRNKVAFIRYISFPPIIKIFLHRAPIYFVVTMLDHNNVKEENRGAQWCCRWRVNKSQVGGCNSLLPYIPDLVGWISTPAWMMMSWIVLVASNNSHTDLMLCSVLPIADHSMHWLWNLFVDWLQLQIVNWHFSNASKKCW